jgi:ABC-type multidrug transport system fused ATPase/permease subunit
MTLLSDSADGVGYLLKDRISDVPEFLAAVRRVARGGSAVDPVVAAALYLQRTIEPADLLLQWVEQAQRGIASFARVLGVGQVPPEPTGTASAPRDERLVVRGARFAYTEGHDVLHGIDLEVYPGERLAIVGPSGAGKPVTEI